LLHSYELGLLTEDEKERFEQHLLKCDHCVAELWRFETQAELLRSHEAVAREVAEGVSAPESIGSRLRQWLWPDAPLVLKPAVALILVALLIYPAWLGIRSTADDAGIAPVHEISLMPSRSLAESTYRVPSGRSVVLEFVCYECNLGGPYRVEVFDAGGDLLYSIDSFRNFDQFEIGRVLLGAEIVRPGDYRLSIIDRSVDPPAVQHQYRFRIVE
jgi:hypothetical protein